jgi:hypothetical protein
VNSPQTIAFKADAYWRLRDLCRQHARLVEAEVRQDSAAARTVRDHRQPPADELQPGAYPTKIYKYL